MKIPTTIVTGFLGSGKTTIISHLIDYLLAQNVKVVFVKNEVGDEDIDTAVMQGKNIRTRELLNGCICCTLVGPFISAIDELIATTHPERIIIEASGAADTASVALMVSSHPGLNRDGVLNVVDVVNFEGSQDLSVTTRRQAEFTDLIVFNKVELADLEQKQRVVGYVREVNEFAPIVEAPQGKLNPELAFGLSDSGLNQLLADEQAAHSAGHDHEAHHHLETDQITAFYVELKQPVAEQQLLTVLKQVPKSIFRIKGIVETKDEKGSVVTKLLNGINGRFTMEMIPPASQAGKIIFVGFRAHEQAQTVKKLLDSSLLQPE